MEKPRRITRLFLFTKKTNDGNMGYLKKGAAYEEMDFAGYRAGVGAAADGGHRPWGRCAAAECSAPV